MSGSQSSATLASAASLSVPSAQATDLLILLRAASPNGQPTTYTPQNITAANWLASLLPLAIATMIQQLPTQDGTQSPLWNNDGALTLTTGGGQQSGLPLSGAAMMSSMKGFLGALGAADPKDGATPWLDDNVLAKATPAGS